MKKNLMITALVIALIFATYSIDIWADDSGGATKAPVTKIVEEEMAASDADDDVVYEPETCIRFLGTTGSLAAVRLYSTTEIRKTSLYDLYTIEKKDGVWVKKAFIRSVEMPAAVHTRSGKYKYYSDIVKIEWLSQGYVYQLIPHQKGNHHRSVPFWRKSD